MDNEDVIELVDACCQELRQRWEQIDRVKLDNLDRVLRAFHEVRLSEADLLGTTGYGYDDLGREKLEKVYARVFGAEAALVRLQIVSGTHAISISLEALLEPGEELLSISGRPYDTLCRIIGLCPDSPRSSWCARGICYSEIQLTEDGRFDLPRIEAALRERRPRCVLIQRSAGYTQRASLTVAEIERAVRTIKSISPETICFVDNCYGEFVETMEPTAAGVDLLGGSLIKNPGGTLAPCGGYVVGREELVAKVADRLMAPGVGRHMGPSLGQLSQFWQGFFLAPQFVAEAVKGALLFCRVAESFGFRAHPGLNEPRGDIVQGIELGSRRAVEMFCRAVQSVGPVNAHALPEPTMLPGYSVPVVMAAPAFVQGASSEISADAPMRPPYSVWVQGGTCKEHAILAARRAFSSLVDHGLAVLP